MRSTLLNIKSKQVLYPPHLSPGAQDFIKGALDRDPARRPSIRELLGHPWVLQFTKRRRDKLAAQANASLVRRSKSDLALHEGQVGWMHRVYGIYTVLSASIQLTAI